MASQKYQYQFFDKNTGLNDVVFQTASTKRVKQTHSNDVIIVDDAFNQNDWVEGDGIITTMSNTPIAVITADCAPVLLYGIKSGKPIIGAAHAGWQGALSGVIENTVHTMGCDAGTVSAYIGPCIGAQSYEVSKGFEIPFLHHNKTSSQFFTKKNDHKLLFDLKAYCAWRLRMCEVSNITISDIDTLTNADYHSHRGGANGARGERNLSAIMISA